MNVEYLRQIIANLPGDMLVVMQKGPESIHASVASEAKVSKFVPGESFEGFVFTAKDSSEYGPLAVQALILMPIR